jgi:predicted enzyme related to lactoylglutathione lyase
MSEDWARPVVHWEIRARDPQRMREFYAQMFNWAIGDGPIMTIPAGIGGPEPGPGGHIIPGEARGVILFVQVLDLHASMEQAKSLGGAVTHEPFDAPQGPGVVTLAQISDPEGNLITLVQQ